MVRIFVKAIAYLSLFYHIYVSTTILYYVYKIIAYNYILLKKNIFILNRLSEMRSMNSNVSPLQFLLFTRLHIKFIGTHTCRKIISVLCFRSSTSCI